MDIPTIANILNSDQLYIYLLINIQISKIDFIF